MSSFAKRDLVKNFRNKNAVDNANKEEELLVFGYASRIYENDEKAEWVAAERHLIAWSGDDRLLIDRYDCRLYLGNLDEFEAPERVAENGENGNAKEEECPTEALEEEMCEEERYKDLNEAIQQEEERRKRAEVEFNYDDDGPKAESSSSEEEVDEPFQPPDQIKLPVGMNLPETMKLNAVMERTASFVVAQGPQMEIVIKAKQRGNIDQFGFLEFDHPLNPYYKYISKMIREKKYTPKPHIPQRRPKPKKLRRLKEEEERRRVVVDEEQERTHNAGESTGISSCRSSSTALAAIAQVRSSDSEEDEDEKNSDDEGHYLHPLLMGGASRKVADARGSQSPLPVIGPKTREEHEQSATPSSTPPRFRVDYELGKGNDVYSSLFKSLSELVQGKPTQPAKSDGSHSQNTSKDATEGSEEKDDYAEWYLGFYGEPPVSATQPAVLPPPPDLTAAVNSAAEYVAKYGCRAENLLANGADTTMHFTKSSSPYYSYYQSRVRYYQWVHAVAAHEAALKEAAANSGKGESVPKEEAQLPQRESAAGELCCEENGSAKEGTDVEKKPISEDGEQMPSEDGRLPSPSSVAPVYMNRKMRRRGFHDPPSSADLTSCSTEIGLVEPLAQMSKVRSYPTFPADREPDSCVIRDGKKPAVAPISFSLNLPKSDDQIPLSASAVALGAYDDDEDGVDSSAKTLDVPAGVVTSISAAGVPPPPSAPVPLASGQLALEGSAELQSERKQRARIFMEKILNEKRAAKLKAQSAELQKKEADASENVSANTSSCLPSSSKIASSSNEARSRTSEVAPERALSPTEIDKMISSQIDVLLKDSSRHKKERSKKERHSRSSEKKRKKKKKGGDTEEEGEIKSDDARRRKRRKSKDRSASRSSDGEHRKSSKKKRKRHSSNEVDKDKRNHRSGSRSRRHRR